jgi:hypothetical protein
VPNQSYDFNEVRKGWVGSTDSIKDPSRLYFKTNGQFNGSIWYADITGTDATMNITSEGGSNPSGLSVISVSVDGSAFVDATYVSGDTYQLFSGLSDEEHNVSVKIGGAFGDFAYIRTDEVNAVVVTGASPSMDILQNNFSTFDNNVFSTGIHYIPTDDSEPNPAVKNIDLYAGPARCSFSTSASRILVTISLGGDLYYSVDGNNYIENLSAVTGYTHEILLDGQPHDIALWGSNPILGGYLDSPITSNTSNGRLHQFGDSITDAGAIPDSSAVVDVNNTAPFFGYLGCTFGQAGATTASLLGFLPTVISGITIEAGDVAVLAIGRNNITGAFDLGTQASVQQEYRDIVDILLANYDKVLARGILPEGSPTDFQSQNTVIESIVDSYSDPRLVFVDTSQWSGISTVDSVHPDKAGYLTISDYSKVDYAEFLGEGSGGGGGTPEPPPEETGSGVPEINNLTLFHSCDPSTWTAATFGRGDAPMPNLGNRPGLDGAGATYLNSFSTPVVAGDVYTAHSPLNLTPVDISGDDQFLILHSQSPIPNYDVLTTDADSLHLYAISGGDLNNWAVWYIADAFNTGYRGSEWYPLRMYGTPDDQSGTFDATNVTGVGFGYKSRVSGNVNSALGAVVDQCLYVNGVEFANTGTDATELQDYINLLDRSSGESYHSALVREAGSTFEIGIPFTVRTRNLVSPNAAIGISLRKDDMTYKTTPTGEEYIKFRPISAGTQVISNAQFTRGSGDYNLDIDSSATGSSVTLNSSLVTGNDTITVRGSGSTISGGTFSNPRNVNLQDGRVNAGITSPQTPVDINSVLTSGSSIEITTPVGDSLNFNTSELDFSNNVFNIPASEINFTAPSGTGVYDLSGIECDGTVTLDNTTAIDTQVRMASGVTAVQKTPTTGGGLVTLDTPAINVDIIASNIIDGTRVVLINYTKSTKITDQYGQEIITTPVVIDNSIVSGGNGYINSLSITTGSPHEIGDVLLFKMNWHSGTQAKLPLRIFSSINAGGVNILDSQVDDVIHNNMVFDGQVGLDGSTVDSSQGGPLSADLTNIEIDVNDADDVFDCRKGIAWWRWINTTEQGALVYDATGLVYKPDEYNIEIQGPLKIKNAKVGSELTVINGIWTHYQGESIIASDSNTIVWVPDNRLYSSNIQQVSELVDKVTKMLKYHDNKTRYLGQDGTTVVNTREGAYFIVTYDDDGVTELKRIAIKDKDGNAIAQGDLTAGYDKV